MALAIHMTEISRRMFACMILCLGIVSAARAITPETDISDTPLYGAQASIHPNLVLSLSVEFPTAGIAYRGDNGTYNRTSEYIGYFNPLKCYDYHGGNRNTTDGYFFISGAADTTTHECDGATFSGNFMNWAASSAIDMMRYALTGGDRVVDTASMTILQRAVLPEDFYASDVFFPRRTVTAGGNVSAPNRVTPFDVATLYVVSCSNRILFSKFKATNDNCDTSAFNGNAGDADNLVNGDKWLGEYLARVQVCDTTEGPVRTDLCKLYGTNYKPVGAMQRNADKIRFAAMGYLLHGDSGRYGGVLRAPMKHVGPNKFIQPGFAAAVNEKREWDPLTGIFIDDPESAGTTAGSGVINYLNKFGRGGKYKEYDPVGELYYEAIRYLQGKQPTEEATSNMSSWMKDGFPVAETWADPVVASCQKNFIVSIADANTHFDRYIPGNTRTTLNDGRNANDNARSADSVASGATPALDATTWTAAVGAMEADTSYGNAAPRPWLAKLATLDTGADAHGSYYMAGLAYWANTHDIRSDKPTRVRTYVIDVDEGGNGEIDNALRTIPPRDSQLYLAAKYGGFVDANQDGNPFATFENDDSTKPTVKGRQTEWDSDGNGIPDNYFLAGQPQVLISSIRKIFDDIGNFSGTTSGVAASGAKVLAEDAYVYQPGFNASRWSGSLKRLKVTLTKSGDISVATKEDWDAGLVLTGDDTDAANPLPDNRRIYIGYTEANSQGNPVFDTVDFNWRSLATTQRALLNMDPATGSSDGLGAKRVSYLRGARALEESRGDVFRSRDRVLGDIVHSNPVYVGAPSLQTRGAGYTEFYEANKDRVKTVYIGANDGMLHAFNAATGTEIFAYIPEMLLPRLNQLTSPNYVHQPYVDGAITVAEARLGSTWKTVLVSGLGGGTQGVFALDVTNPSAFGSTRKALWEFSDSDDPDIGNVVGMPIIAKFRTGIDKDGVAQYRYFAVIASGFNNHRDDGTGKFNSEAPAVLFLLALDKSNSVAWQEKVNYYKFTLPISDDTLQNGLSAPALVVGSDGAVRYAYAGDLQGNLWRLNFTGDAPWSSALGAQPYTPLFVARDAKGTRQPITIQPKVVFAPGGYVVLFGTGKFVEEADTVPANFTPQSFYAIHDTTNDDDKFSGRSLLVRRDVASNAGGGTLKITGDTFDYGTGAGRYRGWYLDFIDSDKTGERSVTNPLTLYGRVFFNTLIPGSDPCGVGTGRSYALDTLSGLPFDDEDNGTLSTIGFLSAPILMEAGAADVGDRDATGRRSVGISYNVINSGTGSKDGKTMDTARDKPMEVELPAGRFSWREILNWQELRNGDSD